MIYLVAIGLILIILIIFGLEGQEGVTIIIEVTSGSITKTKITLMIMLENQKKHLHLLTMTSFGIRMTNKIEEIFVYSN